MSLEFGSFYELSEIDEMDEIGRGEVISEIRDMTIDEFEEEFEEVSKETALWMIEVRLEKLKDFHKRQALEKLGAFHERQALVKLLMRKLRLSLGEAELKLREVEK